MRLGPQCRAPPIPSVRNLEAPQDALAVTFQQVENQPDLHSASNCSILPQAHEGLNWRVRYVWQNPVL